MFVKLAVNTLCPWSIDLYSLTPTLTLTSTPTPTPTPLMTIDNWTVEEQNDEWRDGGVSSISIQPSKSAIKGEASTEQIMSSLASLDSARQLLRDDSDPLDIKDPAFIRQVLLSKSAPITETGDESVSQLDVPSVSIVVTNANFDPRSFLKEIHGDTDFDSLVRGRHNLESASYQRNESLKNLVKQNFERFVNAKNSTELVFKNMQQRRLTDQDHGMRKAIEAASVAYQRAEDVYGTLMVRREQELKIRRKLELFSQYSFIFSLGYRLEQSMKVGEYQTAVFDYRKAKTMMQDATNHTLKSLLHKTWAGHVDKTLTRLRADLNCKLSNSVFTYKVHSKLIDFLIDLDAHPDPVKTFFHHRKDNIFEQCRTALARNIEEISRVPADIDTEAVPRILLSMVQRRQGHRMGMLHVDIVQCWKIRASFFYTITDLYTKFYLDFGKFLNALLSGRFVRDKSRKTQEIAGYEQGIQEYANDFAQLFPSLIQQALSPDIIAHNDIQESSIVTMHYATKAVGQLCEMLLSTIDCKAPSNIVAATQLAVEQSVSIFIKSIWDSADEDCALLPTFETWQSSGEGFDFSTVLVKGFETLLISLIDGSSAILCALQDAIGGTAQPPVKGIDKRLSDAICAFLNSLRDLVMEAKDANDPDSIVAAVDVQKENVGLVDLSVSYKLLTVMTNILYLRQVAIPHLFEAHSNTLGRVGEEPRQAVISTLDRIEDAVKQRFLDEKRNRLISLVRTGTINSGFDWMDVRHPQTLRPYIQTLLLELVAIQTQIYDVSSSILRSLMSMLVMDIFQEFLRCVRMIREFGAGGYLQLRTEVTLVQNKLITIMDQEALDLFTAINATLEGGCQDQPGPDETKKLVDQIVRQTDNCDCLLSKREKVKVQMYCVRAPGQQMLTSKFFRLVFVLLVFVSLGSGSTSVSEFNLASCKQTCVSVPGRLYADIKKSIGLRVPGGLYISVNSGRLYLVQKLCAHEEAENIFYEMDEIQSVSVVFTRNSPYNYDIMNAKICFRFAGISKLETAVPLFEEFYRDWSSLIRVLSEHDKETFIKTFTALCKHPLKKYFRLFLYQLVPGMPVPSVEEFLLLSADRMNIVDLEPAYDRLVYDDRFAGSLDDASFQLMLKKETITFNDLYHLFKPNIHKLSCDTVAAWAIDTITPSPNTDAYDFFKFAVNELVKRNCKNWQPQIWTEVTSLSVSTLDDWRWDNRHFLTYIKILYNISPQLFDGKHSPKEGQTFARCITLLFPIFQERLEGRTTRPLATIKNRNSRCHFFQSLDFFLQISGWQDGQAPSTGHRLIAEISTVVAKRFKHGLLNYAAKERLNHLLSLILSISPPMSRLELVSSFQQAIRGAGSLCFILKRCNETLSSDDWEKMLYSTRLKDMFFTIIINLYDQHKDRTAESPFSLVIPLTIFELPSNNVIGILRSIAFLLLNVPFSKSAIHITGIDQDDQMDPRDLAYLLDFWLEGQASIGHQPVQVSFTRDSPENRSLMYSKLHQCVRPLDDDEVYEALEAFYQDWSGLCRTLSVEDARLFTELFTTTFSHETSEEYCNVMLYQLLPASQIPSCNDFKWLRMARSLTKAVKPAYERLLFDAHFASSLDDELFEYMAIHNPPPIDEAYLLLVPNIEKLSDKLVSEWAQRAITDVLELNEHSLLNPTAQDLDKYALFKLTVQELVNRDCPGEEWMPDLWDLVAELSVEGDGDWRHYDKNFLTYVKTLYAISPQLFAERFGNLSGTPFANSIMVFFPFLQNLLNGKPGASIDEQIFSDHAVFRHFSTSVELFLEVSGWQDGQTPSCGHRRIAEMYFSISKTQVDKMLPYLAICRLSLLLSLHLSISTCPNPLALITAFEESINSAEIFCLVIKRYHGILAASEWGRLLSLEAPDDKFFMITYMHHKHKHHKIKLPVHILFPSLFFELTPRDAMEVLRSIAYLFFGIPFAISTVSFNDSDETEQMTLREARGFLSFWIDMIHSPLTEKEETYYNAIRELDVATTDARTTRLFPGRNSQDVKELLGDPTSAKKLFFARPTRLCMQPPRQRKAAAPPRSQSKYDHFREQQLFGRMDAEPKTYYPVFVCKDASGPLTSLAVDDRNSIDGMMCMAGACAQMDSTYNRPGEVLLLGFDPSAVCCWLLDAHSQTDPQGERYDGNVKFWEAKSALSTAEIRTGPSPINNLALKSDRSLLVGGSQDGADALSPQLKSVQLIPGSERRWCNSVDYAAFNEDAILALVGYRAESAGGLLYRYDATKGCKQVLFRSTKGLSTMDQSSTMVAVGTGGVIDDMFGTGAFYLVDPKSHSLIHTVLTNQMDMDSLRFSNCGTYIACGEMSDNSVFVYDTRYVQRPMLHFSHSVATPTDSLMGVHWLGDGRLVTGGMDGMLKIHSLNHLRPVQEISIGHQVNCISVSTDDSTLFVGTDFGTVHCFSQNPAVANYYSTPWCWVTGASSFFIRYPSSPQFVDHKTTEGVFDSIVVKPRNLYNLLRLLSHPAVNLRGYYEWSCRLYTLEDIHLMVEMAESLSEYDRQVLLSPGCLDHSKYQEARHLVMQRRWPMAISQTPENGSVEEWRVLMTNVQRYPNWCENIPDSLIDSDDLWDGVNILRIFTHQCAFESVSRIHYRISKAISVAPIESLFRSVDAMRGASVLLDVLCPRRHESPISSLLAALANCPQTELTCDLFPIPFFTVTDDTNALLILRFWLRKCSLDGLLPVLAQQTRSLATVAHSEIILFAYDSALSNLDVNDKRLLFSTVDIGYDEVLLREKGITKSLYPTSLQLEMGLTWRLIFIDVGTCCRPLVTTLCFNPATTTT
ncbi:Exocyst complex component sec5 [Paramicrosporidium saccamoebae]|uniref:Exocyst complex component sec5 n=1 Tax=Paramicrosporidium saccamoebae TaxID=1246581 RepID=A0A2H9TKU9_9FUNG|nr:Exocyst complex component sec5 [Paramicrosporidium saccamoebae]